MNIALITGAGRRQGLGFETAKQLAQKGYHVILAGRKEKQIEDSATELKSKGFSVSGAILDLTDDLSIRRAAEKLAGEIDHIDVLINDAALMQGMGTVELQDMDEARLILNTNVIGTWSVTQQMLPLLKKSAHPRIVNVSSGAGSYEDPQYGLKHGTIVTMASVYGISKLALNGLTVKMAKELKKYGILVNAVCPDITATYDVNGYFGRPVELSAKGVVWAATLPDDGPTGGFFRDGKEIEW